nr:MAG TPA: hypothetical protein [Bacteriophage sp.]
MFNNLALKVVLFKNGPGIPNKLAGSRSTNHFGALSFHTLF